MHEKEVKLGRGQNDNNLGTLFTGACPLKIQGFWCDKKLVRVPKNTLSCGVEIFRLTTENHNDFFGYQNWQKNGDVDVEIQNSRILIQKQRTQKRDESHNDTRQQRLFCLRGNSRSWP